MSTTKPNVNTRGYNLVKSQTTGKIGSIGSTRTMAGVRLNPYVGNTPAAKALGHARGIDLPVTVTITYAGVREDPHNALKWSHHRYAVVVIGPTGEVLQTVYNEGMGHHPGWTDPTDVMGSLLSDADNVIPYVELLHGRYVSLPGVWHDWAEDFGYDRNDRRARHAFRACLKTANGLREILGAELFEQALTIASER